MGVRGLTLGVSILATALLWACGPAHVAAQANAEAGSNGAASPGNAVLVYTPEPGKNFGDETAFSRSVAARYPAAASMAALTADLADQGLRCSDLNGVPPAPDMALMDCGRTDQVGATPCFDAFFVTIIKAPGENMGRVTDARYARRCLGLMEPD